MSFSKRKGRLSLERLEMREVPAHLGQVVELPDAGSEAALAAPVAVSRDAGAYLKIKLEDVLVVSYRETASPSIKIDTPNVVAASPTPEDGSAMKVQMQDFHFVQRVDKASPTLF